MLERSDALTWLSLRNAVEVHIVAVDQVNTYDVLATDDVVFTRGAYDAFVGGTASSSERPGGAGRELPPRRRSRRRPRRRPRSKPRPRSTTTDDAKPELPKGAKAPLKSGGAPKGYEVKGNADSGLYHEPDGQWYDADRGGVLLQDRRGRRGRRASPAPVAAEGGRPVSTLHKDHRDILLAPVVSEKSYGLLDANKYTFLVHPDANKTEIKIAVEKVFGVKVTSVNTINRQGKTRRTRTGLGKRKNTKRAIVSLAEGHRIDIFGGPVS